MSYTKLWPNVTLPTKGFPAVSFTVLVTRILGSIISTAKVCKYGANASPSLRKRKVALVLPLGITEFPGFGILT